MEDLRHYVSVGDEVTRAMPLELRAEKDGKDYKIAGIGAPYEKPTVLWESKYFIEKETYARGCFKDSVASGDDIISCFNHDVSMLLGRRSNNTLTVTENDEGVRFETIIDKEDPEAMRVYRLVETGRVSGSSVRFRVLDGGELEEKKDGIPVYNYRIKKAVMRELGPVTEPAYPDATSETRSRRLHERAAVLQANREFLRELEIP